MVSTQKKVDYLRNEYKLQFYYTSYEHLSKSKKYILTLTYFTNKMLIKNRYIYILLKGRGIMISE